MTAAARARCSVVICTFDRAPSLARALRTLAAQDPPLDAGTEVIVVDNNSSDATGDVLAAAAAALRLRRVREPVQGLARARNRGVREAAGELLVFCDDDVLLDAGWLAAYRDAAARFPDAGYFGGRIRPHWVGGRPRWVRDETMALLAGVLVCADHGTGLRPYTPDMGSPLGASFAVRRRLLAAIGGFDERLGRTGGDLGRGEDSDFFARAVRAGHRGIYVGPAFCRHRVTRERLRLRTLFRYGLAKARAERIMAPAQPRPGSLTGALDCLARGGWQLLRGRGDRFRQCVINAGLQIGRRG